MDKTGILISVAISAISLVSVTVLSDSVSDNLLSEDDVKQEMIYEILVIKWVVDDIMQTAEKIEQTIEDMESSENTGGPRLQQP